MLIVEEDSTASNTRLLASRFLTRSTCEWMESTTAQEADTWAIRGREALVFFPLTSAGDKAPFVLMMEQLIPWQQKAKEARHGHAAPWHVILPYLAACGIAEEDFLAAAPMRDGGRSLNLSAMRMWEALASMGLVITPVESPREYFLRVLSFLKAQAGVLGAQSMLGEDLFDDWELHDGESRDPTFMVECMPIAELTVELGEQRFHLIPYATILMLVGRPFQVDDRQEGTQFHLSSAALMDAVAEGDSAVRAMRPLMDRALQKFHEAVDALDGQPGSGRGSGGGERLRLRRAVESAITAVKRMATPIATMAATWWKDTTPEEPLFMMEHKWPIVLGEVSVRTKLRNGKPHEIADVVRSRLHTVLEQHRSLSELLKPADRAASWMLIMEMASELELSTTNHLLTIADIDTMVGDTEMVRAWEAGGQPRERVAMFLKAAKTKRKPGATASSGKQVDQSEDIFGAQSVESLMAVLDVGQHTRYAKIQAKVEALSKQPEVMPQQKLQVILTGSSTVSSEDGGEPVVVKGEPDVACQLLVLSNKTKSSVKNAFITQCIALRVHLLSYMGYYLAMDGKGTVLSDMMAFAVQE